MSDFRRPRAPRTEHPGRGSYLDMPAFSPSSQGLVQHSALFLIRLMCCLGRLERTLTSIGGSPREKSNYINLGELVAGPICCSVFGPLLENEDVVWFVDNTSALSALIRRASSTEDLNTLALVFGLSMTALRARVWFEYIQSASNPSDVLSRKAWGDLDVQQRLASGEWTRVDAVVPWQTFSIAQVPDLFRAFQACLD